MIDAGARLVTERGLVHARELLIGDMVLTHLARFKQVKLVTSRFVRKEAGYQIAGSPLWLDRSASLIGSGTEFFPVGPRFSFGTRTVNAAEWAYAANASERRSAALRPRGVAIAVVPGAIVLGIVPGHAFGSILFASRIDSIEYVDITGIESVQGWFYDITVEEDRSYVAERFCVR